MQRMPALETPGSRTFFCGPESFTPDDRYHLGEAPNSTNLFVAAGFNSIGIQSAGGVGKVLAEWMRDGRRRDLWEVDVRRNLRFQNNRAICATASREGLGLLYAMHWPFRQFATSRGVQTLPFTTGCRGERLLSARLRLGTANWFAPEA